MDVFSRIFEVVFACTLEVFTGQFVWKNLFIVLSCSTGFYAHILQHSLNLVFISTNSFLLHGVHMYLFIKKCLVFLFLFFSPSNVLPWFRLLCTSDIVRTLFMLIQGPH